MCGFNNVEPTKQGPQEDQTMMDLPKLLQPSDPRCLKWINTQEVKPVPEGASLPNISENAEDEDNEPMPDPMSNAEQSRVVLRY